MNLGKGEHLLGHEFGHVFVTFTGPATLEENKALGNKFWAKRLANKKEMNRGIPHGVGLMLQLHGLYVYVIVSVPLEHKHCVEGALGTAARDVPKNKKRKKTTRGVQLPPLTRHEPGDRPPPVAQCLRQ